MCHIGGPADAIWLMKIRFAYPHPGVLAVVLLVTTRVAGADRAAEKLFRDGQKLLKAGKVDEACDAFERSEQLEPRIGSALNLAACRERQGRTATAWALFLEAKARAAPTKDRRGATAADRAAQLEPQLSFLTVKVAPDRMVEGLAIKRGGTVVPPTAWNTDVPLDPAVYTIEASAPRYNAWSTTQPLKPGDHITVTIGPLVAEPTAVPPETRTPPVVATIQPEERTSPPDLVSEDVIAPAVPGPVPTRRPFAVGLALGVAAGATSSAPPSNADVLEDDKFPIGVRILGSLPAPGGAVRAIGSVLYTKGLNDKTDSSNFKKLYVVGLGADYVWMPMPRIGFAAGIGMGWDYEVRALDQGSDTSKWTALRASPIIVRLMDGHVEVGAHLQLIRRGDETGFIGLAAVDVFPF